MVDLQVDKDDTLESRRYKPRCFLPEFNAPHELILKIHRKCRLVQNPNVTVRKGAAPQQAQRAGNGVSGPTVSKASTVAAVKPASAKPEVRMLHPRISLDDFDCFTE